MKQAMNTAIIVFGLLFGMYCVELIIDLSTVGPNIERMTK